MGFNIARSVGPAIGGAIVAAAGAATAFAVNCVQLHRADHRARALASAGQSRNCCRAKRSASRSPPAFATWRCRRPSAIVLLRGAVFGIGASAVMALMPLIAKVLIAGGPLTLRRAARRVRRRRGRRRVRDSATAQGVVDRSDRPLRPASASRIAAAGRRAQQHSARDDGRADAWPARAGCSRCRRSTSRCRCRRRAGSSRARCRSIRCPRSADSRPAVGCGVSSRTSAGSANGAAAGGGSHPVRSRCSDSGSGSHNPRISISIRCACGRAPATAVPVQPRTRSGRRHRRIHDPTPQDVLEFLGAMAERRRIRRRDGATQLAAAARSRRSADLDRTLRNTDVARLHPAQQSH